MGRTIVTTSHQPDSISIATAITAAEALRTVFVERERMSLAKLRERYSCENVLVVKNKNLRLHTLLGEFSFHPSMSVPRIKAIRQGKPDNMVEAMGLKAGDTVLDCTLGLGSDAIVAAFAVGSLGCVVGTETAPELAYIVRNGLHNYDERRLALREAMTRIEVVSDDYHHFLQGKPDNSYDIIYFDPMFRFPRTKSAAMEPLRKIFSSEPITSSALEDAVRVARRRVVFKENYFSKEFQRLGFTKVVGGKHSPVAYGIINKLEAET